MMLTVQTGTHEGADIDRLRLVRGPGTTRSWLELSIVKFSRSHVSLEETDVRLCRIKCSIFRQIEQLRWPLLNALHLRTETRACIELCSPITFKVTGQMVGITAGVHGRAKVIFVCSSGDGPGLQTKYTLLFCFWIHPCSGRMAGGIWPLCLPLQDAVLNPSRDFLNQHNAIPAFVRRHLECIPPPPELPTSKRGGPSPWGARHTIRGFWGACGTISWQVGCSGQSQGFI